jgi:aquaporin Z
LVIATAAQYRNNHVFGLVIGFTLLALVTLGATTTGGVFNPAISFGSAIMALLHGYDIPWYVIIAYVVGAYAGGALAACTYKHFMPDFDRA